MSTKIVELNEEGNITMGGHLKTLRGKNWGVKRNLNTAKHVVEHHAQNGGANASNVTMDRPYETFVEQQPSNLNNEILRPTILPPTWALRTTLSKDEVVGLQTTGSQACSSNIFQDVNPHLTGPSMFQQLQMSQTNTTTTMLSHLQTRINFRAPPPTIGDNIRQTIRKVHYSDKKGKKKKVH